MQPVAIKSSDIDPLRLGKSFRDLGITMEHFRHNPDDVHKWIAVFGEEIMQELVTDWQFLARDEQLPPAASYKFWLYMAGRGAGKTRTGAEWTKDLIKQGYNRGGLIAPTAADARDVMVEGESGLLAVCNDWDRDYRGNHMGRPLYEPSKRRVTWENGALVSLYSAEEPERLRGPQHSFLWCDELAAWIKIETYDQAMFGLRLGKQPRVFVSTTPKPKPVIKKLYARAKDPNDPAVVITTGSSERNSANLAPDVIQDLRDAYGGTQLARQELDGVLLEELEGALWTRESIDNNRVKECPTKTDPEFYYTRIVIGVDPATTDKEGSDETGIVVAAIGCDGFGYVLGDYSGKYSPKGWGDKVAWAYHHHKADCVIAEVNQGGDMVKHVLAGSNEHMPVKMVHASRGKLARAEPIAQKYEQNKVRHVGSSEIKKDGSRNEGHLDNLEDQMCTWERLSAKYSPDRIDALVWAIHELMIEGEEPLTITPLAGSY